MKKLKTVLMIGPIPPPFGGGMAAYMEYLLQSELPKNLNLLNLNTSLPNFFVRHRKLRILLSIKFFFQLIIKLALFNPNIVHIHTSAWTGFWEKSFFLLFSKSFGKRTILHIHGSDFQRFCVESKLKILIIFVLNKSDKIVVLSSSWKKFFEKIVATEKLVLIENMIDISKYSFSKDRENKINILFVGSIGRRKGLYVILESILKFPELQSENIGFYFLGGEVVYGDFQAVLGEYEKYNLTNVHFMGVKINEEKYTYFKNADIFILPSYDEGLPIALLEAMASSLPVISTTVGGIPDLVGDKNGILISPGDANGLAKALITLINDEKIRKQMGRENREKIEKNYSIPIMIQKIIDLYNSFY